jgi:hypothetical protein
MKERPRLSSFFEEPEQHKFSGSRLMLIIFGLVIAVVWAKTSWKDGPKPIDPSVALFYFGLVAAVVAPKFFASKFGAAELAQSYAGQKTGISAEKTTTETLTVTPEAKP